MNKDITKVVFVAGLSHTGTTLLDVCLGSKDNNIKSCGELHWLQIHYTDFKWVKNSKNNRRWPNYKDVQYDIEEKNRNVYKSIRDNFDVNTIIDSSKFPQWYKYQLKNIYPDKELSVKFVVIFKSPYEMAYSMWKRNKTVNMWTNDFIFWYEWYMEMFHNALYISYYDLANKPAKTIKTVCNHIGIPYKEGKERFWEDDKPHLVAGCSGVMSHFFPQNSDKYKDIKNRMINKQGRPKEEVEALDNCHKQIYYDDSYKTKLPDEVKQSIDNNYLLQNLYKRLYHLQTKIK